MVYLVAVSPLVFFAAANVIIIDVAGSQGLNKGSRWFYSRCLSDLKTLFYSKIISNKDKY
jgi:hypothetical protein